VPDQGIQQKPAEIEIALARIETKTSQIQPNPADFIAFANAFFKKSSLCSGFFKMRTPPNF
jgi:hypothetical protein